MAEPYFDQNGNGVYDVGEPFVDLDGEPASTRRSTEAFVDANGERASST